MCTFRFSYIACLPTSRLTLARPPREIPCAGFGGHDAPPRHTQHVSALRGAIHATRQHAWRAWPPPSRAKHIIHPHWGFSELVLYGVRRSTTEASRSRSNTVPIL